MAGKYLWFALFVTLQISFVLCRSAGKTDEEGKEFIVSPTGDVLKAEALKETVAPGTMLYDEYNYRDNYNRIHIEYQRRVSDGAIVGIVFAVFVVLSLILGCILMCVCNKKQPRRGFIVNRNTGGQTGVAQQYATSAPGIPATGTPMQQFPSPNQQFQNQNIYPAVHPSN